MSTTALCAWCLRDAGQVPDERDSHGICRKHAARLMREAQASRAARKAATKKQAAPCTR